MPSNPFAVDQTQNAVTETLKEMPDRPSNQAAVGMVAKQGGDVGMEAHGEKDLGKGFSAEGDASWMRRTGWSIAGWLTWKGK